MSNPTPSPLDPAHVDRLEKMVLDDCADDGTREVVIEVFRRARLAGENQPEARPISPSEISALEARAKAEPPIIKTGIPARAMTEWDRKIATEIFLVQTRHQSTEQCFNTLSDMGAFARPLVSKEAEGLVDDERERFEKTVFPHGLGLSRCCAPGDDLDGYQSGYTNMAWKAWKARTALLQALGGNQGMARRETGHPKWKACIIPGCQLDIPVNSGLDICSMCRFARERAPQPPEPTPTDPKGAKNAD